MKTQIALALTEIAKPLTRITVPIPEPKEHQLLIKVSFVGITPLDQKLRDYNIFNISSNLPAILALDLVGEVVKAGSDASNFPARSKVFSQALFSISNNLSGGLQQYTLHDERFTVLVPKNISEADVAILPINVFTSATALFTGEGLNGGFGFRSQEQVNRKLLTTSPLPWLLLAVELPVASSLFSLVGSPVMKELLLRLPWNLLRSYGATHILDRKASNLADPTKKLVGDDLVYLYDTFNRGDHTVGVSLLSNTKKRTLLHLAPGRLDESAASEKKAGFEQKQLSGASTPTQILRSAFGRCSQSGLRREWS
ncbi:hypothetical protein ONS95_004989 [Cadophora gregata]|uniref:uncharacterized protein n=1 Tax=Cadophora gregata TaxID=51156 RepID=UPI0026DCB55A|nr:uncharacterized protein ONS95_004989 [Cadophora gregata]KAK0104717.1 hypothetical protein ONS95_004989 [Cadophora gregata]KAK0115200.1 hypothetical protein ONS96_013666 [Cadophora gregata f. sp. sojae]